MRPVPTPATIETALGDGWRPILRKLEQKNWVSREQRPYTQAVLTETARDTAPELTADQSNAVNAVLRHGDRFGVFLLNGITGSGKTEVYLQLIEQALQKQRQALVLVPEIGLTPQLVSRFRRRLDTSTGRDALGSD